MLNRRNFIKLLSTLGITYPFNRSLGKEKEMGITFINTLSFRDNEYRTLNKSMVYNNAYVCARYTGSANPRINRINLTNFTLDGYLDLLESGSYNMYGFAHDYTNGYLYVNVWTTAYCRLYKIRLSDFSIDSYNNISSPYRQYIGWQCGSVDPINNKGYWVCGRYAVKINLDTLTPESSADLGNSEYDAQQTLLDLENGYLYCAGDYQGSVYGSIHKIRLSDFSYVSTLPPGDPYYEYEGSWAFMFIKNGYLYVPLSGYSHSRLVKIRLSDFTRIINLDFEEYGMCFTDCDNNGCGYVWTPGSENLYRISLDSMEIIETFNTCVSVNLGSFIDSINNNVYLVEDGINPSWIYKYQVQCQLATPCENNLSQQTPIGGSCETFSDSTPNFSKIRSAIEL